MADSDSDNENIQPANIPDWLQGSQPKQEPAASVESLGASSQEQDDAVAWLESLAAKHGAKPEELVTDPNKRSETPPDWVAQAQNIGSQSVPQEPAKTEWVEGAQNIGEEFFAEFEKGTSEPAPALDETGMWLKDLESKEETPAQPAANIPDWLSDIDDNKPAPTEQLMGTQNLSDWLSGLDDEPGLELDPEILRASERPPFSSQPEPQATKTDVPDWLSNLESDKEADDDLWKPPASTETVEPVSASESMPVSSSESAPDWLDDTESGIADSLDEGDLPPWLHREKYETGSLSLPPQPKPTSPSDWQPVSTEQPVQPQKQQQPAQNIPTPSPMNVEKKKPVVKQPRPKKAEGQTTGTGMLNQAKAELDRGDIPEALLHYGKLIKRGKNLEEIIRDLNDSLYRYPVEVNIWQALGDAYMRANRLKEALDSYNKAEELIR